MVPGNTKEIKKKKKRVDQSSRSLEIEDKVNLTLLIKK